MKDIGERLKLARKMAHLSQQELADRAGVSKMAISKYEHNQMLPGSDVLLKLANALGVRMEFFLRSVPELEIKPVYRAHSQMNKKAEEAVIAQVQEWLERYIALENLFPPEERLTFTFPGGFPYPVRRMEDAEQAAETLRAAWRLGDDAIENMTELLELSGIKVGLIEGDDHFDACTFWINDQAPVIAVKQGVPGDRERFDLAHELGHIMMDVDGVDEEKAAYRFAAAFLVPAHSAFLELGCSRRSLDPYELLLLKKQYGMSMAAWIHRAQDLGILSPGDAQRTWQEFSARGWRKHEPSESLPTEEPQRQQRLILRLLAEDVISRSKAKELLGERVALFSEQERVTLEVHR
ncbi:MAG TPA: XRE family transcriptional regulator [Aggregatilineaceae bacterium]|nr:XRE family transcriptional regulator [Aggregatilineaceae bacterium]